jgi:hypothetical protein
MPGSLSTIDLMSTLTVTDAERFTRTLLGGIGRSKAFGRDLLCVRRTLRATRWRCHELDIS